MTIHILLPATNLPVNLIPAPYDSSAPIYLHNGHMQKGSSLLQVPVRWKQTFDPFNMP